MKRKDIVNTANSLSGAAGHKFVVDKYNSQNPLPRGYKVTMKDAWCATFTSAVFLMNGFDLFSECSCIQMIEKAKRQNMWVEDDTYRPKKGDVLMYDWQDNGKGNNTGSPDHVGIVIEVKEKSFIVREGNKGGSIGNREMPFNSKYIRGFITPKYGK